MNNRIAPETQLITKRLSLRSKILPQPQFRTSSARPRPVRYGLKAWRSTISGRLPHIPWSHVVSGR